MTDKEAAGISRGKLKSEGSDAVDYGFVTDAKLLSDIGLREVLAKWMLLIFAVTVGLTYTIIFLWGFKKIDLPYPFVHWLGGATVGQTAGMLILILQDLFPTGRRKNSTSFPSVKNSIES